MKGKRNIMTKVKIRKNGNIKRKNNIKSNSWISSYPKSHYPTTDINKSFINDIGWRQLK